MAVERPAGKYDDAFWDEVAELARRVARLRDTGVEPPSGEADMPFDILGAEGYGEWLTATGEFADMDVSPLAETGTRLVGHSLAEATITSYRQHFLGFARWCHHVGVSAPPASPQALAAYITHVARTGSTRLTADGTDGSPLRPSTISTIVTAVGEVHRRKGFKGAADPTEHEHIRTLIKGYRREQPGPSTQARAIDLVELGLMASQCVMPRRDVLRDLVLVALATHPSIEVNANQLGRLRWDHVALPAAEGEAAALRIGPRTPTVWVAWDDDPAICPVRLLMRWHTETGGVGPVFESSRRPGKPITRQAIAQRVNHLLNATGGVATYVRGELPRLDRTARQAAAARLRGPDHIQLRDLAMMSLMWWAGLRASEAAALRVADVEFIRGGQMLVVTVTKSKTDQYGHGFPTTVAAQDGYIACAVGSMRSWLSRYAADLGRTPTPDEPLFPQLHRGRPGPALGYDGVNETIKRWAAAAGIEPGRDERISSHGLRAGNVVDMLDAGHQSEVVAKHQRRKGAASLKDYYRPTNLDWNPTIGLAARRIKDRDERTA